MVKVVIHNGRVDMNPSYHKTPVQVVEDSLDPKIERQLGALLLSHLVLNVEWMNP
jgi:hypothetical protein